MSFPNHADLPLQSIHRAHRWQVADTTALNALTPDTADLYKLALKLDDNSLWLLTDIAPLWQRMSNPIENLGDLADVNASSPGDGEVLTWDSGTSKWIGDTATASVAALDDIGDVVITSVADDQVLTWDAGTSKWVNQTNVSSYDNEQARDAIGAALVAGNNIDITVNDGADTITIDVEALTTADLSDFSEAVQDIMAGHLVDSSSVDITYDDGANTLSAAVIYAGSGSADTAAHSDHTHTSVKVGMTVFFDGDGSVIASGLTALVKIPYACTVTGWELVADQSGSLIVIVYRAPTATPSTFTEISGSSDPTISSVQTNKDTSISGDWSDVTLDEGDWLKFVCGAGTSVTFAGLALDLTRTI